MFDPCTWLTALHVRSMAVLLPRGSRIGENLGAMFDLPPLSTLPKRTVNDRFGAPLIANMFEQNPEQSGKSGLHLISALVPLLIRRFDESP